MAVDDVVGCHVCGRYQSQNIVNTLHFKITQQTVTDHQILQLLAVAWDQAVSTIWLARHIDSYLLIGAKFFSVTGQNKRPGIVEIGNAGSVVGSEVPSPMCRVLTMYTDSDNFRRRGRLMISGCDTAMFDDTDGSVTSAERTALSSLADVLMDPVTVDEESMIPCIPPTATAPVETITSVLPRKTPACIRSRRVRGFNIG
jgi:hypothetical protein